MSKGKSTIALGKGGIAAIIGGSVAVLALTVVVTVLIVQNSQLKQQANSGTAIVAEEKEKRNVVVTPENVEEVMENLEKQEAEAVAPGSYEVTMNTTWYFEDGKATSSNAYVENSVANTNDVYFDIVIAGTDEKIYSSPLLPIGSHINNIALDKELENGTYDCIIIYTLVDEDQTPLSTVQISLEIVIGK